MILSMNHLMLLSMNHLAEKEKSVDEQIKEQIKAALVDRSNALEIVTRRLIRLTSNNFDSIFCNIP